jgi:2,3-bisphosphoglycerate-independent phosphoglycerate mutase
MASHRPVMLIVLDGWGIREMEHGNAIVLADTPNYDGWLRTRERAILDASGEAVGLVPGQMGNSEVGHLNLGAGRIVYQDITRIDLAIRDKTLEEHPDLIEAFEIVRERGCNLHLIGLLSDGGVHSHERHLHALLEIAGKQGINPVVHVITDGRDTPPNSGLDFVRNLEEHIQGNHVGQIATLSGRYYIMDRDKRWDRTRRAYDALVYRKGERAQTASEAIQRSYDDDVTDEFAVPYVIGDDDGLAIKPGDVVVFFNFRADRMRQIVQALALDSVDGFDGDPVGDLHILTFTEYMDHLPAKVLFTKDNLSNTLAEVLSAAGLRQYHSAETEKYPHVTFFFNGRREEPWAGEDRQIIPSPKVATYDLKPEMSAEELTEATLARLKSHDDDFILINYANPDMVGHTGSLEAAIKAVTFVDTCAGRLVEAVLGKGGVALVTADHGNADRMINEITGDKHTYHTTNPVSFFAISGDYISLRPRGILADVAPTVLELLQVEQPEEMSGQSLIDHTGA